MNCPHYCPHCHRPLPPRSTGRPPGVTMPGLADRRRALRPRVTQADLAVAAGVTTGTVSRAERGLPVSARIAQRLHLAMEMGEAVAQ